VAGWAWRERFGVEESFPALERSVYQDEEERCERQEGRGLDHIGKAELVVGRPILRLIVRASKGEVIRDF
jgi:hypothetical protein